MPLIVLAALGLGQVGGCYYLQAAGGQLEILRKREPIEDVIRDPESPEELKARLTMLQEARRFAVDELLLPDNKSYRTFADLERDYVVWNVMAAPEFSLEPRTWCYPVVGCVAYRGYFSEDAARGHAEKLRAQGYDVFVGGVAAYSTLGRFADPLLNTMMHWSDAELVALLFHELAHQRLYIRDDTGFNESYATAVAEIGLERWLERQDRRAELDAYVAQAALRTALMSLVDDAKSRLVALYESDLDDDAKRASKRAILEQLTADADAVADRQPFPARNWLQPPLNNARLVSLVLYRGQLEAFREMLRRCDGDIACFHALAAEVADLPPDERRQRLDELASKDDRAGRLLKNEVFLQSASAVQDVPPFSMAVSH